MNRAGHGSCASRDCRSGSRSQAIDLSLTSTSVQVCTSVHLVMYGGKCSSKVLGSLKFFVKGRKMNNGQTYVAWPLHALWTPDLNLLCSLLCSLVFGLGRIFPDRRQEGVASIRRRNLAV